MSTQLLELETVGGRLSLLRFGAGAGRCEVQLTLQTAQGVAYVQLSPEDAARVGMVLSSFATDERFRRVERLLGS